MRFFKSDSGYALVLTLLFMPVFIGMSLLVIDISRGNNAHSDLQAAADALALAGARELDGGVDSIDRALDAMSNVSNTVSFLGRTDEAAATALTFEIDGLDSPFTVVFLSDLPENDDTPLTQAYLDANAVTNEEDSDQGAARFVYVRAQSRDLSPFFGLFFEGVNNVTDVPVAAQAVATFSTAACNVTPLFICNPFEEDNIDFGTAFERGDLHGRLIRLHPRGQDTASPGNFGFLQVIGANDNTTASANAIRSVFAGETNPTCYDSRRVNTKPGGATSISQGFNVRFDIYEGTFSNNNQIRRYPPATNVRKGYVVDPSPGSGNLNYCSARRVDTDELDWALPFPDNVVMDPPSEGAAGAFVGSTEVWDINEYWRVNHTQSSLPLDLVSSFSGRQPSRYDVYMYEIAQGAGVGGIQDLSWGDNNPNLPTASTTGSRESGVPMCYNSVGAGNPNNPVTPIEITQDRRVMFAAILDCDEYLGPGSNPNGIPVNTFASIFLVNPMEGGGSGTIDVEIIDITGASGNGTLDTFVRDEANLVR
ncbi:pilus assembly protein TadG-related protein [Seohaeicola sp. SP36]|uniref:pilus assembly protein TadG-related protein n=1 Tax=unclassified Seohaeicola TaxID=2641111 RepID=UPI00237A6E99|nr:MULTISPECIES: pilus assembly protein TadG-related protein [unclassified Seohaeicola]MDD9709353.1 pilus assembly protein TadG-related protein [Seohaeicola sp. 4SK31]MDD9737600.1 pilus assembly protein TadG-related protein [Seohaeicola sp. SP36]